MVAPRERPRVGGARAHGLGAGDVGHRLGDVAQVDEQRAVLASGDLGWAAGTVGAVARDAQGRILIPANLRTFAELQKDVTVIGQLDHAEIWNSDKWRAYNDEIDAEVVAADVEDIDF